MTTTTTRSELDQAKLASERAGGIFCSNLIIWIELASLPRLDLTLKA